MPIKHLYIFYWKSKVLPVHAMKADGGMEVLNLSTR